MHSDAVLDDIDSSRGATACPKVAKVEVEDRVVFCSAGRAWAAVTLNSRTVPEVSCSCLAPDHQDRKIVSYASEKATQTST